jgi:hypothetical protein
MADALKEVLNYVDLVKLSADGKTSVIEIVKVGKIYGRRITITEKDIDDYIANFEKKVYRTDLQVNLGHNREGEAAGWIKRLYKVNGVLFAEVEWTPLGVEKVSSKQFRYTSSELAQSYVDPVTGAETKNVLIGVALTNIPQVKGMAPVSLSEESPYSENCISFLNQIFMKDKAKTMYDGLMKKDAVTQEEMSECMAAAKDAGCTPEEMADMKKKLSAKVAKKMSEGEEKEEKEETETDKEDEKKLSEVSLAELNEVKKMAEATKKENALLQERLDRSDLKEAVQEKLMLSEKVQVGFVGDDAKEKVVNFMMKLKTTELRNEFCELIGLTKSVDLSTRGSSNVAKTSAETKEDQELAQAEKNAKELSEKSGRPFHECLSEEYAKLEEAKK